MNERLRTHLLLILFLFHFSFSTVIFLLEALNRSRRSTMPSNSGSISHDMVAELREAFGIFDSSGEGSIDISEMKSLLFSIVPNMTEEQMDQVFMECQIGEDESVTFAQFFVIITNMIGSVSFSLTDDQRDATALSLYEAFTPLDPDNTGYVDANAFLLLMSQQGDPLSTKELEELHKRLEATGHMQNGQVNYKAFLGNLVTTRSIANSI